MKTKLLSSIAGLMLISHVGHAQFYVKDLFFQTTGVSNQGMIAGYEEWTGPYSIWDPTTQTTTYIGGVAPGNGVGGQAAFSADGNFLSGTSMGTEGTEMSRFNVTTNSWEVLGSLGFSMSGDFSGGYSISGDGTTVVGNSWGDTAVGGFSHAIAWTEGTGINDLGTLFEGKSTRANAVNGDGSIVVGWQDFNGPWKAAVWRKNIQGVYQPNTYLLKDPLGSATDEYNQLGECSTISADGNWIGGHGDFATNGNPWIWSETTGYVDLGTLHEGAYGYVAALSETGAVAVGRIQIGPWDPEIPFIWTEENGMQNINEYATDVLGLDLGTKQIYSANCMSPSGQYIVGYGYDTVTFDPFAYRLSAWGLSVSEKQKNEAKIYPNPASDKVILSSQGKSEASVSNLEGKVITSFEFYDKHGLDVSKYGTGIYFISIRSKHSEDVKTIKFVKD